MTFLWLWAYALKFPLSIICGLAVVVCFLTFAAGLKSSNSRTGDGRSQMMIGLNVGILFALLWAGVYSLPAPNYDVKVVYKDRIVEKPVVKRYIAQRQVVTRTITKYPTRDNRIKWCLDNPHIRKDVDECTAWAVQMEKPRVVVKKVPVRVYSGVKVVQDSRDQRVAKCISDWGGNIDNCTDWAIKMETPLQVRVMWKKSPYMDIYKWCNETYSLSGVSADKAAEARNQRLAICADVALKGSK